MRIVVGNAWVILKTARRLGCSSPDFERVGPVASFAEEARYPAGL